MGTYRERPEVSINRRGTLTSSALGLSAAAVKLLQSQVVEYGGGRCALLLRVYPLTLHTGTSRDIHCFSLFSIRIAKVDRVGIEPSISIATRPVVRSSFPLLHTATTAHGKGIINHQRYFQRHQVLVGNRTQPTA